jgi:hypothetical protein
MTEDGQKLGTVRITNSPAALAVERLDFRSTRAA